MRRRREEGTGARQSSWPCWDRRHRRHHRARSAPKEQAALRDRAAGAGSQPISTTGRPAARLLGLAARPAAPCCLTSPSNNRPSCRPGPSGPHNQLDKKEAKKLFSGFTYSSPAFPANSGRPVPPRPPAQPQQGPQGPRPPGPPAPASHNTPGPSWAGP
ncbi:hypothetical protein FOCC_FOCC016968, partial [Frankliniella occidentalis]